MSRRRSPQLRFRRKAVLVVAGVSLALPLVVGVLNVPILKAQTHSPSQPETQPRLPEGQQPSAEKKMEFEVATIKLAAPDADPKNQMLRPSPSRA